MADVTGVLFVCHANLCRSPLAHGILQHHVTVRGLASRFHVDSAGTWAAEGRAPHPGSVAVAQAHGISLAGVGLSRSLVPDDLERFDHVLVADRAVHADVLRLRRLSAFGPVEGRTAQIRLIRQLVEPDARGERCDVPDPLGGGAERFERVFALLDAACLALLDECVAAGS